MRWGHRLRLGRKRRKKKQRCPDHQANTAGTRRTQEVKLQSHAAGAGALGRLREPLFGKNLLEGVRLWFYHRCPRRAVTFATKFVAKNIFSFMGF